MIKLIYKLFKKDFNKLVFEDQVKPDKFHNYKFAFLDKEGRKYYEPVELGNIGLDRYGDFQKCLGELGAALSHQELKLMAQAITSARAKDDWDMVTYIVKEWELREKTIVPKNILYNILCDYYVREDEHPDTIDVEIQDEKANYFMNNVETLGFFLKNELMTELLGLPRMSQSQLNLILENSEQRIEVFSNLMEKYKSQNESSKSESNSEST